MPNPKRRHSKSRRDMRRATWKMAIPAMSTCSNCSQTKLPHRVCPHCGYYNGRKIVEVKES